MNVIHAAPWPEGEHAKRMLELMRKRIKAARPEWILSELGDMVFDGDEGYEELLASLREQQAQET